MTHKATLNHRCSWLWFIILAIVAGCHQEDSNREAATLLNLGQATESRQVERLVSALDPTDRELLRQRQIQFNKLPESQKQSLREIHQRLCGDPSSKLYQTLHDYSSWLALLPDGERAALLELPPAERIAKIKNRQREVIDTPLGDIRLVVAWLHDYARQHERELLRQLPREVQDRLDQRLENRDRARMFMLLWELARRSEKINFPATTREEIASLVDDLSDSAHQTLSRSVDFSNPAVVPRQLLQVSSQSMRGRFSGFDPKRLMSFYESDALSDQQRDRLNRLPPNEAKMQLQHLYQISRMEQMGNERFDRGRRPERSADGEFGPDRRPLRRPYGRRAPDHPPGPPPFPPPEDRPRPGPPGDDGSWDNRP